MREGGEAQQAQRRTEWAAAALDAAVGCVKVAGALQVGRPAVQGPGGAGVQGKLRMLLFCCASPAVAAWPGQRWRMSAFWVRRAAASLGRGPACCEQTEAERSVLALAPALLQELGGAEAVAEAEALLGEAAGLADAVEEYSGGLGAAEDGARALLPPQLLAKLGAVRAQLERLRAG